MPSLPERSLVDVTPSLLSALGAPGFDNRLDVGETHAVCLLLIDALGWELLTDHAADAPFLAELAARGRPITAGFPATTAASVATLGTGRSVGEHGIVGISFEVPGHPLLHALSWRNHGSGRKTDLRDEIVPEQAQPQPTALERAVGVTATVTAPPVQHGSGLTRAVLRGGRFRTAYALGDLIANVGEALSATSPAFCYAYHGDLDAIGHVYGPGSPAWRYQLRQIDHLAAGIAEVIPPGGLLAVVADHGMVRLAPDEVVDADTTPALREGVRGIAGDIRARHVYAEQGAADDVLAAWRDVLGERADVVSRDDAIAGGWFGPRVADLVRPRIGDVVTASRGGGGVLCTRQEPLESKMTGHHASYSTAEQLVPFLTMRNE
ncbi:MAG TPA: nucleotide pyrophosphatase/phosphodiesterase family protein [Pseudonocardiaceae bacterium]|nr:nucleotide pyrophosphatase/phosphodiesterase family protein [Pseudonocardiaceae bacterium]